MRQGETRLGVQVFVQLGIAAIYFAALAAQKLQAVFSLTQAAAHEKAVAGFRRVAAQGVAAFYFACYGDADQNFVATSGVAAGERTLESPGSAVKSSQKFIEPLTAQLDGERQTQQETTWNAAHSSDVANRTGQAFPADGVRGMFVAEEVRAFQGPVAGENCFMARRGPEKSGIVADAKR